MHNITLIIPAKNESESLPSVLNELKQYPYKISIPVKLGDEVKKGVDVEVSDEEPSLIDRISGWFTEDANKTN